MTTPQDWAAPDDRPGPPAAEPDQPAPSGTPARQAPAWQPAPGWGGSQPQPWQPAPGWGGPPGPPPGHAGPPPPGWGGPAGPPPGHAGPPPPGWGGPAGPPPGWGGPPPASGPGGWGWGPPPAVKPGVVPLRPLGLGELLDGAVGLIRRYPRPTLGLSAVIALVTTLLNAPLLVSLLDSPLFDATTVGPQTGASFDAEIGGLVVGFGASAVLSFLAGIVLAGVIAAVVGKAVLGQPMSLHQAWTTVRPLLLRLLGLAVVVALAVWGAFALAMLLTAVLVAAAGPVALALGVPLVVVGLLAAVHLYVRLALAPSVMVLERASLRESLRRSGLLVRGDWWRVFGILLLVLVITSFVSQVLQTPFAARSLFADGLTGSQFDRLDVVLSAIGSGLALAVVAPFGAAVSALLYVDRRMRAEGLDVALSAAAAASRPA